MKLFKRISQVVTANINHLLDQAEDPEVMIKQIIREMEESIIELRREAVKAVARQIKLEKQVQSNTNMIEDYNNKAKAAINNNNEATALELVSRRIQLVKRTDLLNDELKSSKTLADQIKSDLSALEDQVQDARRKKEELIRRKRAAEAKMNSQNIKRKSVDALAASLGSLLNIDSKTSDMESYEDAVSQLEAEAEAAEEILKMEGKKDKTISEIEEKENEKNVKDELEKLKKQLKKQ